MERSLIMCGSGGQGILLGGSLALVAAFSEGKKVTWLPSYGAEKRGGLSYCAVVISDEEIMSPVLGLVEYIIGLDTIGFNVYKGSISKGGVFIINSSLIKDGKSLSGCKVVELPISDIAKDVGSNRVVNMVSLGVYAALSKAVKLDSLKTGLEEVMSSRHKDMIAMNIKALERGYIEGGGK